MSNQKTKSTSISDVIKQLENGLPAPKNAGFLGANFSPLDSKLLLIPVPWEATTSYGGGTSKGPDAIKSASHQLDMEDPSFGSAYRNGIAMLPVSPEIKKLNAASRPQALKVIEACENGQTNQKALTFVNRASSRVNELVFKESCDGLDKGKLVGVVGGDHSSPYGLIKALAERDEYGFGILHFDAHHDLRCAYEGFNHSHASIFYNVMEDFPSVTYLTQVGIRDYSGEERRYMEQLKEKRRGSCFYARDIFGMKAEGHSFKKIASEIVATLPERVYVSFDIDGLDPTYCPSTGTPVPGGLSFEEAVFILEVLVNSGKRIVGFDLCEVAPGKGGSEWDANVGARMLYKLCGAMLRSHRLC